MFAQQSNSLPMDRPLNIIVAELVGSLPSNANSVNVCVVIENLRSVTGSKVAGYPLVFFKPTPEHEEGQVYLSYGVGNLESA